MSEQTHLFHTVAVSPPGTHTRVLVTELVGSEAEVLAAAKWHVQQFAEVAPVRWRIRVTAREEITDIPFKETA